MKVSVVISTYNGEKYIYEQLESIRNQTRKPDEVLIFDDVSTDNTVEIVKKYLDQYKLDNWILYENVENKGWKKNFMEGLWFSNGDLIFPCDQDDIWCNTKIEEMEYIMIKNSNINVLTSNYDAFYDSGKIIVGPNKNDGKIIRQPLAQNIFNTKYPGCTYCVRKQFVELGKKYWEKDFPHDALFWRLGMFSNSLYSYNKSLIKWRKHSDSTYAIESLGIKNYEKKRAWLDYAMRVTNSLKRFISIQQDCKEKEDILDNVQKWIEIRILFFDTHNIIYWLKLMKYRKCYDRVKQYLGDLYLVFLNGNRGNK